MLFNSLEFLFIFLPATWIAWRISLHVSEMAGIAVLLAASTVYYAVWEPRNLLVLVPLALLTYALGLLVTTNRSQLAMIAILVANLGTLAWFKYAGFLSASVHALLSWIPIISAGVALPLGISFFVFQKVAFAVDAHKGTAVPGHPGRFMLFVMFFPQLIAGPIVHYRDLAPQLTRERMERQSDMARGLFLFAVGLAMKVLLADPLAPYVKSVYEHTDQATWASAWIATMAFGSQIYFDFSGYGVMAVGLALMFGVHLPFNFDSPYKATSVVDFWRRWNITLSQFLRDYLYIPLGGNRAGRVRSYANLMITMLVAGLWHGAGWTFVLWGGIHGLCLWIAHASREASLRVPGLLGWALTFSFVMSSWVFFRAPDFQSALHLLSVMSDPTRMSSGTIAASLPSPETGGILLGSLLIALTVPNAMQLSERFRPTAQWAVFTTVALTAGVTKLLYAGHLYEFIYFRF